MAPASARRGRFGRRRGGRTRCGRGDRQRARRRLRGRQLDAGSGSRQPADSAADSIAATTGSSSSTSKFNRCRISRRPNNNPSAGEKPMSKRVAIIPALMLAASIALASCSGSQPLSTREEGTLGGAGIGAVGGALVGAAVGHPGAGAAIGAGLGGVTVCRRQQYAEQRERRRADWQRCNRSSSNSNSSAGKSGAAEQPRKPNNRSELALMRRDADQSDPRPFFRAKPSPHAGWQSLHARRPAPAPAPNRQRCSSGPCPHAVPPSIAAGNICGSADDPSPRAPALACPCRPRNPPRAAASVCARRRRHSCRSTNPT